MKTPMTQNFINNYLNYDDDFTLIELSKLEVCILCKLTS